MSKSVYRFDSLVQKAYSNTLNWLDNLNEMQGTTYLNTRQELRTINNPSWSDIDRLYGQIKQRAFSDDEDDLRRFDNAACQFYSFSHPITSRSCILCHR